MFGMPPRQRRESTSPSAVITINTKVIKLLFLLIFAFILFNHSVIPRGKLTVTPKPKNVNQQSLADHSFSIEEQRPASNPIKSINLIGERHSGTNWIGSVLQECFGDQVRVADGYTRWKHWFQYDVGDRDHPTNSSLVVVMFRNPYQWVQSMRQRTYRSPIHRNLDWKPFVTTPWTIPRPHRDEELIKSGSQYNATCYFGYTFNEVVPCLPEKQETGSVTATYELNHDGSGNPYDSILGLRSGKIKNFLDVAKFDGVASFLPLQYEYLVTHGTRDLIKAVENITGLQAPPHCGNSPKQKLSPENDAEYIEWMNEHVDWEVEKLIGYSRRDAVQLK